MTLSIQYLTKTYGEKRAVDNISLELPKGEVLGLLGRNGAGKTTTIKMMLGLIQPDNGTILWEGKPFKKDQLSVGYLPEERGLYPKSKIVDQLRYFGMLEGVSKKDIHQRIDYWLEKFQIPEYKNKLASELSKGNQQKIQIISTLLHDPEIVILDEPFSGLDPVNATLLSEIIEEQVNAGKTIILSSHQMGQIEAFCKNIVMMKDGKIIVSGKLQKIKDDYGYKNLSITSEESLEAFFQGLNLTFDRKANVYTIKVHTDSEGLNILNALSAKNIPIQNYSLLEPSLHQIFVERVS
jgi:ABC-2 type transport system ATP-binding protein